MTLKVNWGSMYSSGNGENIEWLVWRYICMYIHIIYREREKELVRLTHDCPHYLITDS